MRLVEEPSLAEVLAGLACGDEAATARYTLGKLAAPLRADLSGRGLRAQPQRHPLRPSSPPTSCLGSFGEVLVVDWGLAYDVREGAVLRAARRVTWLPSSLIPRVRHSTGAPTCSRSAQSSTRILALHSAFTAERRAAGETPVAARARAAAGDPGRAGPALHERARAGSELRLPSARAMAEAIESFPRGDQGESAPPRASRRAGRLRRDDGRGLRRAGRFSARPVGELAAIRERIEPWDPPARKQALWMPKIAWP